MISVFPDAQLQWLTASEVNNDYFDVQRSIDGVSFGSIGRVTGTGNASEVSAYDFTDRGVANLGLGRVYYRLRQVDFNGGFQYSNLVEVRFDQQSTHQLQLFPNPASNKLYVNWRGENQTPIEIRIFDALGRMVFHDSFIPATQFVQKEITLAHLSAGIYQLSWQQDAVRIEKSVMVTEE